MYFNCYKMKQNKKVNYIIQTNMIKNNNSYLIQNKEIMNNIKIKIR